MRRQLAFFRFEQSLGGQRGQSLTEFLVLMLALLVFLMAIPWLGRLLDISLNQSNASAYAAFQHTRQLDTVNEDDIKQRFFLGSDKNWRDRQQKLLLDSDRVQITIERESKLNADMQPGMQAEYSSSLRRDWQIEDKGIVQSIVTVHPQYSQVSENKDVALGLNLSFFDRLQPQLQRHTAILSDAAHASSDLLAHQRTEWSKDGWRNAADSSYELGRKIQSYAGPVDQGFKRVQPVFDWLQPWAGKLPRHHLQKQDPNAKGDMPW